MAWNNKAHSGGSEIKQRGGMLLAFIFGRIIVLFSCCDTVLFDQRCFAISYFWLIHEYYIAHTQTRFFFRLAFGPFLLTRPWTYFIFENKEALKYLYNIVIICILRLVKWLVQNTVNYKMRQ